METPHHPSPIEQTSNSPLYFILDETGHIVAVSEAVAAGFGYTVEELKNLSILKLFHPEDQEKIQSILASVVGSSQEINGVEVRLLQKAQSWVSVRVSLQLPSPPNNSHKITTLLLWETHETSKPIETAPLDNENIFRTSFEESPIGLAHINLEGRFLRVNRRLCEILERNFRELESKTLQEIALAGEFNTEIQELRSLWQGEIKTCCLQKRFINSNQALLWLELKLSLLEDYSSLLIKSAQLEFNNHLLFSQENIFQNTYFIAAFEDITQQRVAEEKLQKTARNWLAIIETVGEGITLSDEHGKFEVFNSKMEEITGYTKEEANSCPDFSALLYPDPQARYLALAGLQEIIQTGGFRDVETTIQTKNKTIKTLLVSTSIVRYENRNLFLSTYRDITQRKHMEEALLLAEEKYRSIFENSVEGIFQTTVEGRYLSANPALARIYGYSSPQELIATVIDIESQLYVQPNRRKEFISAIDKNGAVSGFESLVRCQDGRFIWISENARCVRDPEGKLLYYEGTVEDITAQKYSTEALRQQAERDRVLGTISFSLRQSINLGEILSTVVEQVREFLQTDCVLFYRFQEDGTAIKEAESLEQKIWERENLPWENMLFLQKWWQLYKQTDLLSNVQENFHPSSMIFEDNYHVIVPIAKQRIQRLLDFSSPASSGFLETVENPSQLLNNSTELWGLLVVCHWRETRQWLPTEIDLLTQLAIQIGVAIQQSELYQQLQIANADLEIQIQERTAQLQQAIEFEATLKRIADKVRDSLDESHILQTAVRELVLVLGVECCDTSLYNAEQTTAKICYEYARSNPAFPGQLVPMSEFPGVYTQLLAGECFQFCTLWKDNFQEGKLNLEIGLSPLCRQVSILACPIVDDQGVLGDLWLFNQREYIFGELQIRLVQQVANQCAIAIRQARLYEASQAQVKELQRLSWLKDDFLSTVSHELRTPLANMKMAIQMLALALNQDRPFLAELAKPEGQRNKAARYFQILRDECEREISLINDLLDLQRFDDAAQEMIGETIDLLQWLPNIVEPFYHRAENHGQLLEIELQEDLPPLVCDSSILARILTELLNNACKYTPEGEQIFLKVSFNSEQVQFLAINTGVEIPSSELSRIFDKFYRIPKSDPWRQGGTGLGLTLVKKLVDCLGGSVQVESSEGRTSFSVILPLSCPSNSTT